MNAEIDNVPLWMIQVGCLIWCIGLRTVFCFIFSWLRDRIEWNTISNASSGDKKKRTLTKRAARDYPRFVEDTILIPFYILFSLYDYYILIEQPWYLNDYQCAVAPESSIEQFPVTYIYYNLVMAFYAMITFTLVFLDVKRHDFKLMLTHHIFAFILVAVSFNSGYWMVGTVVMACHNFVDALLFTVTAMRQVVRNKKYTEYAPVNYFIFAVFAVSYFLMRILLFSKVISTCFYAMIVEPDIVSVGTILNISIGEVTVAGVLCTSLLCGLLIMHIYWFWLILKMSWRAINQGVDAEDVRDG